MTIWSASQGANITATSFCLARRSSWLSGRESGRSISPAVREFFAENWRNRVSTLSASMRRQSSSKPPDSAEQIQFHITSGMLGI
jgi:hypothetical protein